MFEAENLKDVAKELLELTEAKSITEDGKPINFEGMQDLYKERVINFCDLIGAEDLYLGDSVKDNLPDFEKQEEFIKLRSEQIKEMKEDVLTRYVVFLELAMNKFVHAADDDLYGEVCNSYYGDVDQDAIELFESFNNFQKETK